MTDEPVGRLLAAGNTAEVFEWGSDVVKLYRSPATRAAAFREAANHSAAEALGLPVPAIRGVRLFNDRWGIVFRRVTQVSFAEQIRSYPNLASQYIETLARLHGRIHRHAAKQFGSLKAGLAANIRKAGLLDEPRKRALLRRLTAMPTGDRLCHGDFHPINVLGEPSQPIVIDWPDARRGDPAADVCRSYLLLKHNAEEIAAPYLDAYCRINDAPRQNVFDWLPFVAAARLAEDVPSEFDRLLAIAHS